MKFRVSAALAGSTAVLAMLGATAPARAEEALPSQAEMWRIIQQQQAEIRQLKGQAARPAPAAVPAAPAPAVAREPLADAAKIDALERRVAAAEGKIEATGAALDEASNGGDGWWQRTSLGGYGELHFNGGNTDMIDAHRFVLAVGHRFNDWLKLQTEVELEHSIAGEGEPGEIELEQAYIEADLTKRFGFAFGDSDRHSAVAGQFLLPIGLLNQTHEPTNFFGVERNTVENRIIPTTWWEAGAGLTGQLAEGLAYDLAYHSGLSVATEGSNAFSIRSGRQKVGEAPAKEGAVTSRLRWNGLPGVELGVSAQYQSDITQGGPSKVDATLVAAHADILKDGFGLRALYARWDLGGSAPALVGRDEQQGWYVEPSYRFDTRAGGIGFFARYEMADTEAGDDTDSETTTTTAGTSYWPHPDVVLKADYQWVDAPTGNGDDRVNLDVGFQF